MDMTPLENQSQAKEVPGYHPVTRWLHAGLVLGVLFQMGCALWMAHPDHQGGGHEGMRMEQSAHGEAAHGEAEAQDDHASAAPSATHEEHATSEWRQALMQAHRTGGVLVALIVLANLFWALKLRGAPSHRQIGVLYSLSYWRQAAAILVRLPFMLVGKVPLVAPGNALSLIVEMLGLLVMSVMAVTGAVVWRLWSGPGGTVSHDVETLMGIHSFFAILLLCYLVGHVSMALIHAKSGDRVFARISPFGND
ncbi:MAG: cytochrome b/b6 domain-containing protein [Mariprofundales bacterium]